MGIEPCKGTCCAVSEIAHDCAQNVGKMNRQLLTSLLIHNISGSKYSNTTCFQNYTFICNFKHGISAKHVFLIDERFSGGFIFHFN